MQNEKIYYYILTSKKTSMKKAFTLVELLVVISIIAITSIIWISSFFNFVWQQEINSKISTFEDDIKSLDKKVKNREIFDYKIVLEEWKKTYKIVENSFDLEKFIAFSGSEIVLENAETSDNFGLKIYKWEKLSFSSWSLVKYNLTLDENYDYKIIWFFPDEINNIKIKNFEQNEKTMFLLKLTSSNIQRNKVMLKNILWKKFIVDNSWSNLDKLKIIFEKDGKEWSLEIAN